MESRMVVAIMLAIITIIVCLRLPTTGIKIINQEEEEEAFVGGGANKKKNYHHYGYINTFYTELAKEKMDYFVEPLPLQGIKEPSVGMIQTECKQVFDWTNSPTAEMSRLRDSFKAWDEDPIKPFLALAKSKNMKINRSKLDKLVKDCAVLALKLKIIYNRARPYQECYNYGYPLKYLRSAHGDTPSFPSSYALQAFSVAYVLGRKYEKHQALIEKVGNDIAWSRVYSGNNFESDIASSKQIVLNLRMYLESIDI